MKNLLLVLVLLTSGLVAGCQESSDTNHLSATGPKALQASAAQRQVAGSDGLSANYTQGLMEGTSQRHRRIKYINNVNTRMLVDDWDMIWLQESSIRLTPYIIHVGR